MLTDDAVCKRKMIFKRHLLEKCGNVGICDYQSFTLHLTTIRIVIQEKIKRLKWQFLSRKSL